MYFRNYGLWNTWLNQYLRGPLSKHLLTSDMVNSLKRSWNRHHKTFIKFIDDFEVNLVKKSLS